MSKQIRAAIEVLAATVLVGVSILSTAPPGFADQPDPWPLQVVPAAPTSGSHVGAAVTIGTYQCGSTGTMRDISDGLVEGYCTPGTNISLGKANLQNPPTWWEGYAGGNYGGCGWFLTTNLGLRVNSTGSACTGAIPHSYFATRINQTPSDDGAWTLRTAVACHMYLNVKPWQSTAAPADYQGDYSGSGAFWRYSAKDTNWVMARIPAGSPGVVYTWVFVNADCLVQPPTNPA